MEEHHSVPEEGTIDVELQFPGDSVVQAADSGRERWNCVTSQMVSANAAAGSDPFDLTALVRHCVEQEYHDCETVGLDRNSYAGEVGRSHLVSGSSARDQVERLSLVTTWTAPKDGSHQATSSSQSEDSGELTTASLARPTRGPKEAAGDAHWSAAVEVGDVRQESQYCLSTTDSGLEDLSASSMDLTIWKLGVAAQDQDGRRIASELEKEDHCRTSFGRSVQGSRALGRPDGEEVDKGNVVHTVASGRTASASSLRGDIARCTAGVGFEKGCEPVQPEVGSTELRMGGDVRTPKDPSDVLVPDYGLGLPLYGSSGQPPSSRVGRFSPLEAKAFPSAKRRVSKFGEDSAAEREGIGFSRIGEVFGVASSAAVECSDAEALSNGDSHVRQPECTQLQVMVGDGQSRRIRGDEPVSAEHDWTNPNYGLSHPDQRPMDGLKALPDGLREGFMQGSSRRPTVDSGSGTLDQDKPVLLPQQTCNGTEPSFGYGGFAHEARADKVAVYLSSEGPEEWYDRLPEAPVSQSNGMSASAASRAERGENEVEAGLRLGYSKGYSESAAELLVHAREESTTGKRAPLQSHIASLLPNVGSSYLQVLTMTTIGLGL